MKPVQYSQQEILDGKIFAVLAYLSILCIIPLVFKKDNQFVLSHGKQGLVLFVSEVAIFIGSIILSAWIIKLCFFILGIFSLWGIIKSLQGQALQLPVVWDIAEKITL